MKRKPGNIWSYITLFLLTGIGGFLIVVPIGYAVTKILKRPMTTYDDYGWRGFGVSVILLGVFILYVMIILIFEGEIDFETLFIYIMLVIGSLYLGKKFIMDWT